jgi:hypothetical protein
MKTRSTRRVVTSVVPSSSMRARSTRPHGSVQRTGSPRLSHIWRRTSYHPCRSTGGPVPGVSSRSSTPGFIDTRLTIRLSGAAASGSPRHADHAAARSKRRLEGTSPRPLSPQRVPRATQSPITSPAAVTIRVNTSPPSTGLRPNRRRLATNAATARDATISTLRIRPPTCGRLAGIVNQHTTMTTRLSPAITAGRRHSATPGYKAWIVSPRQPGQECCW